MTMTARKFFAQALIDVAKCNRTKRKVTLFEGYRTRLTAVVVTGQLNVRLAAVHLLALPAAIEAPEPDESPEELEAEEIKP